MENISLICYTLMVYSFKESRLSNIDSIFDKLNISKEIRKSVQKMGFKSLTDVQTQTLPYMMEGRDMIALAPTGTGKTLAFAIPMLEYVSLDNSNVQEIILCPTRELALQIADEITSLARYIKGLRIAVICGGFPIKRQIARLQQNPHIIVGTPGRVLDLMNRRLLKLSGVHTMVLDEADEMFTMGFVKDVSKIIEATPSNRQLVLFSATSSVDVMNIAWKYLYNPVEITIEAKEENRPNIAQYTINTDDKLKTLIYLIDSAQFNKIFIFVNTKTMCEKLDLLVKQYGYDCRCLHGDIKQNQRSRIMDGFKSDKFNILIATDVAARGIDVDDVEAVINYDLPNENEYYLHRIGRTGRAKKYGVAFSLLSFREKLRMQEILKYIDSVPIELHFNNMDILLDSDNKPFFDNI